MATYGYLVSSPLVSQIIFKTNNTTRMTTTKQHDLLNRLQQISSAPAASGVSPVSFGYTDNTANQRTGSAQFNQWESPLEKDFASVKKCE